MAEADIIFAATDPAAIPAAVKPTAGTSATKPHVTPSPTPAPPMTAIVNEFAEVKKKIIQEVREPINLMK